MEKLPSFPVANVVSCRGLFVLTLLFTLFISGAGCSGRGAPPPDAQLNVEEVATWYQMYRSKHNRQPPPNEQAFVDFIRTSMKANGIDMREDFLVSPRDGKKFVVRYGKPFPGNPIVVHEQEGYEGKKWAAPEMGHGVEMDDAELQKGLSAK